MESLSEYVQLIMDEKNLKVADVARRSKGGLGETYITSIIKGEATNLTIESIKALALGLGVDEIEIFNAARGVSEDEWTVKTLLRVMQKSVDNSELGRLVRILSNQKPAKIRAILKSLEAKE
ncbi:MAG TPA: helix-turn-helix transcriptional regulator [Blastocatellia bacterium]|nr:helix-turn-helix transcriptional regulator [Blastocatellia bacterium]